MGATCGTLNCKGKKNQKYPGAMIIKRPTLKDLSQDDDLIEHQIDNDIHITIPPDNEEARIGLYF